MLPSVVDATKSAPLVATEPGAAAAEACAFVAEHVKARSGRRWLQGRWDRPFVVHSTAPEVRLVAEMRLHRIERQIATALVGWANGERPVDRLHRIPTPREVLALQARGRRCVSLLQAGIDTAPHEDALAFALHDLCHLEKFVDPEHHLAQVGFFATLERAMQSAAFSTLERGFDEAWEVERDHVASDMNGSPIYLFGALKMKLKMATRRRFARDEGREPPRGGILDEQEERAFASSLEELVDAMELHGATRDAAILVSTRRDQYAAAVTLQRWFETIGARALG